MTPDPGDDAAAVSLGCKRGKAPAEALSCGTPLNIRSLNLPLVELVYRSRRIEVVGATQRRH